MDAKFEKLQSEVQEVQDFLDDPMPDNVEDLHVYGNQVASYVSRTGEMVALADEFYNLAIKNSIFDALKENAKAAGISKRLQVTLIDAHCSDYKKVKLHTERLNAACTHRQSWCQSKLRYYSDEVRAAQVARV